MAKLKSFILVCTLAFSQLSLAEGTAGKTQYVQLKPAFVVNYGTKGKMKYIRTDVALRVSGDIPAQKVRDHTPYIRNNLVFLLSAQEAEIINSTRGREALREIALEEVRALMSQLEGQPYVDDLYFQNFVVQN